MSGKIRKVADFTILPVSYSNTVTHYLYIRKNAASDSLPDDRTLFVVNLPPDVTEGELKQFFGDVETVLFGREVADGDEEEDNGKVAPEDLEAEPEDSEDQGPPKKRPPPVPKVIPLPVANLRHFRHTGHTAHIIFHSSTSLEAALSLPSSPPQPWPRSKLPLGLSHYIALHKSLRPPLSAISAHADSSLEVFEYEETQRKSILKGKYKKGEAIVDDDGFTLVTRGGAYGQTLGGGVAVASKKFMKTGGSRMKKKKSSKKEGFYAFQSREKKLQAHIDMKRKWQEDLQKVEKLKESRRFKPY